MKNTSEEKMLSKNNAMQLPRKQENHQTNLELSTHPKVYYKSMEADKNDHILEQESNSEKKWDNIDIDDTFSPMGLTDNGIKE